MSIAALVTLMVMATMCAVPKITRRSRLAMAVEPAKPCPTMRNQIIENAKNWLGVPYQLGGNSRDGIDCSTFASVVAWGNDYYTTDLIYRISHSIDKEELQPGDAFNIPEPGEKGHIYIFDRWANEEHSRVWVYDSSAACGGVYYREIDYDDTWVPIRYNWVVEEPSAH